MGLREGEVLLAQVMQSVRLVLDETRSVLGLISEVLVVLKSFGHFLFMLKLFFSQKKPEVLFNNR